MVSYQECLTDPVYHDVHPSEQTPDKVRQWIVEFLETHAAVGVG